MYQVFCDGVLIADSRIEELCVINPIVQLEVNAAGWFNFTFPATHPYINSINPLVSVVRVERDGELLFQGFSSSNTTDIFGNKAISCEGELAYLNDSILRQARYQGITIHDLLEAYIEQHNSQVEERKRFILGRVTVVDQNNYVYCYTNMNSTMKEIKEDLIDDYGGYISVRYESNGKYIDYLTESDALYNHQTIELGKNLISYDSNIDNTAIATRVIPLGQQLDVEVVEGLPARLDIKSVNDGKDYLDNTDAIANYGIITKVVNFDNITVPQNLKDKGQEWLNDNQFENVTINVTAFDLSMIDENVQSYKLFDNIRVISRYHGMDKWFMLSKIKIDLANPQNDTYTLGQTIQPTLTVRSNSATESLNRIEDETAGMQTSWLKKAKQQASDLISGADGGYVVLNINEDGQPFELLVMDAPTKETARKVWRWNQNGFGYSSTGYEGLYGTAITMNGEIVADYIKAGIISGIEINNGNGTFRVDSNGNLTANSGTFKGTVATKSGTGYWLDVEAGNIEGGSGPNLQHGYINFTFGQVFPDASREGILIRTPAIGLKGRIATNPDSNDPGNASTERNVLVRFRKDYVEKEFTVQVGGQTGQGSIWVDEPVFEYAEVTSNGVGTWHTLLGLNFVNGLLCIASENGGYYPL